ncbi:MAG TPA: hypothetical protein ENO00_04345 [Deltaproteobacteria bacterium]|nr:hypothetical protein [Deltaproteobacteria bacterium]
MAGMERKYHESRGKGEIYNYVITYGDNPVKSMKKTWKTAKEDAGIDRRIHIYDIRHFYITYAPANGAGIMDLVNCVGHTTPSMILKVYAYLVEEMNSKQAFEIPHRTEKVCRKNQKSRHSRKNSGTEKKRGYLALDNP